MKLLRLAVIVSLLVPTLALAQRGGGGSRGGGGGGARAGGGGGIRSGGGGGAIRSSGGGAIRGGVSGGSFRGGGTTIARGGNTAFRGGNRVVVGSRFNTGFRYGGFYPGLYLGFGYGYPYYGGYYDPYYYDPYYYGSSYYGDPYYGAGYYPQPNYDAAYAQPAPAPTVINQSIGTGSTSGSFYRPADFYLIAFNDHTIQAALTYRVEGNQILYTTREHEDKSAPLDTVDRRFSAQVNRDRHIDFRLP